MAKGKVIVSNIVGKSGKPIKYNSVVDDTMVDNWEELVGSKHIEPIKVTEKADKEPEKKTDKKSKDKK